MKVFRNTFNRVKSIISNSKESIKKTLLRRKCEEQTGPEYKAFHKNIPAYLQSKGITSLYHFTDKRNLQSIIEHKGLYSWYGLQQQNIDAFLSSNELSRKLDLKKHKENYIRLTFHNYHPMMTKLKYEENIDFVCLEIDLEIACLSSTLFSNMNATDHNVIIKGSFDFLKTLNLDVFKIEYKNLDPQSKKYYQAEVLVQDFLPIQYIKNLEDLKRRYL